MHVDLSLEELKVYQGKNPKPDDFSSFWKIRRIGYYFYQL